ncbi:MAG: hypothetical protein SOY04_12600 [Clostridium celatum]|nr:hypothetical protein [Clostridium celatum]
MDKKELFSLIKFIVAAITIVVIVGIISTSGSNLKFEHKDFQIEVSGQEKNTQPR